MNTLMGLLPSVELDEGSATLSKVKMRPRYLDPTPLPFVCNDLNGGPALSVATRSRRETVERLERLERAQALLEQLEPDFETGHSKIQDLPLTTSNTAALHQATEK